MANTKKLLNVQISDLQKLISPIYSIAENNPTMPILKTLKLVFDAATNTLSATATDLSLQGTASIKLENAGAESFALCVQAKKTFEIVNALSGSVTATFEAEYGEKGELKNLKIKAGRSKFSLATLPSMDYPEMRITADENQAASEFSLDENLVDVFRKQLTTVRGAAATNDIRFVFMGVLFEVIANDLRLTATNGHRLSRNHFTIPDDMGRNMKNCKLIIGNKGVYEIAKFVGNTESMDFVFLETFLLLKAKQKNGVDLEMAFKSIDGAYPDVGRIIPQKNDIAYTIKGNAAELGSVIKRLLVLNDTKQDCLVMMNANTENGISFSYENKANEVGEEVLSNATFAKRLQDVSDDISLHCNGSYLIDAVNLAGKDGMNFALGFLEQVSEKAMIFKMQDPENKENMEWKNFIHVLMPAKK